MAEAFGVAAGVVGVASFTVQLVQAVAKLKRFCDDVSNAPEELRELTDEISLMSDLLQQLSSGSSSSSSSSTTIEARSFQQCLDLCGKAVEKISDAASALQDELDRKRKSKRARLKFVLKRETFDRLLRKLERGKGHLLLAHQAYVNAQCRDQLLSQQRFLDDVFRSGAVVVRTDEPAPSDGAAGDGRDEVRPTGDAGVARRKEHRLATRDICQQRSFHIKTPSWLANRVWDFALSRSLTGWTVHFRAYFNEIDQDVVNALYHDDLEGFRNLMVSGKGTMYDRSSDEPLYLYALVYRSSRICDFLEQHGVDQLIRSENVVHMLIGHAETYYLEHFMLLTLYAGAFISKIIDRREFKSLAQWYASKIRKPDPSFCDDDDYYRDEQDSDVQILLSLAKEDGLRSVERSISLLHMVFQFHILQETTSLEFHLEIALGTGEIDPAIFHYQNQMGMSLAHLVAKLLACSRVSEASSRTYAGIIRYLASGFNSTNLHHRWQGLTPLQLIMCMFEGEHVLHNRRFNRGLRSWIGLLAHGGVDLLEYGDREMELGLYDVEGCVFESLHSSNEPASLDCIQLESYGRNIENWRIRDDSHMLYAGEFLKATESSESLMPGSWIS